MKLIRDKVPELAAKDGVTLRTRHAGAEERWRLLRQKLLEEAQELNQTQPGSEAEVEELADVLEVVQQLIEDIDTSEPGKVLNTYLLKRHRRGEVGFVVLLDEDEQ